MPKLLIFFISLVFIQPIAGQQPVLPVDWQQELARGDAAMAAFENDSALTIFARLAGQVSGLDEAFELVLEQRQAAALERAERNEEAIQRLLLLVPKSLQLKNWQVLTETYINLARLHEKLSRFEDSERDLLQVEQLINEHQLDSMRTWFHIRKSSHHRMQKQEDSAHLHITEAIKWAEKLGQANKLAEAQLVMGLLLRESSPKQALQYFQQASDYWAKVNDYNGLGASLLNRAKIRLRLEQLETAQMLTDSCFKVLAQREESWLYAAALQQQAAIFNELGQADSAWHYLQLGHQAELNAIERSNAQKVAEIESRFEDEQKARKITEQQSELFKDQQRKRNLWLGLIGLTVLVVLLSWFFVRLRKAKKRTDRQAHKIFKTNQELNSSLEQQRMLLGEVHHRVKNNLQIIISLLELQMDEMDYESAKESLKTMSGRIFSMAAIHEMMYQQEGLERVELTNYIQTLCSHVSGSMAVQQVPQFDFEIPNLNFNLETLIPLGIILNELLTNSIKYGRQQGEGLKISLKLSKATSSYLLVYRDNGPGLPEGTLNAREGGLGTLLLQSMVRQLQGSMETWNDSGAVFNIQFKEKNKT